MLGIPSPYPHPPIGGAHERASVRMMVAAAAVVVVEEEKFKRRKRWRSSSNSCESVDIPCMHIMSC